MTYATNILKDNVQNDMMVVMKPRRRFTSWTLHSGSVYRTPCAFNAITVEFNGSALTEGSSATLSAGQWYYDFDNQYLYVRKSDSTAPGASDWIVATVELFLATTERLWHRVPTDSSTRVVQYWGVVKVAPAVRQARTEQLLGFYPIESTGLSCVNDPYLFQDIIWDGSFNDAEVGVYHVAGSLETDNVSKIITGKSGSFSFSDAEINFVIYDSALALDTQFVPAGGTSYFPLINSVEPDFAGKPIRTVFGLVNGFRPVNVDYNADAPSTSNNRVWAVDSGTLDTTLFEGTVTEVPTLSTPKMSLSDIQKFKVGDKVWVYDVVDGSGDYVTLTGVNYATGGVVLSSGVSGAHLQVGSKIRRSFVTVQLIKGGTNSKTLVYGRDYTQGSTSFGTRGFTLTSSAEANQGVATFDPTTDRMLVNVEGRSQIPTLGGSDFGARASNRSYVSQGIVVMYDILKTYLGLTESEIDTSAFTSVQSSNTIGVGFAVPYLGEEDFPSYKTVISNLLASLLLVAQIDKDGKFSIKAIAKVVTADSSINSDDIRASSWKYDMDYTQIGGVKFLYRNQEYLFSSTANTIYSYEEYVGEDVTESSASQYLHKTRQYRTFRSMHDGQDVNYTTKVLAIFAERAGRVSFEINGQFYQRGINDSVSISRTKLPGFDYDPETNRSRNFRIIEIQKELGKVTVVLDDQKGIDDSGVW